MWRVLGPIASTPAPPRRHRRSRSPSSRTAQLHRGETPGRPSCDLQSDAQGGSLHVGKPEIDIGFGAGGVEFALHPRSLFGFVLPLQRLRAAVEHTRIPRRAPYAVAEDLPLRGLLYGEVGQ